MMTEEEARTELAQRTDAPTKYPWAEWTSGSWWKITQGEDYNVSTDNMWRTLTLHAQRHSMTVQAHRRGESLIFKFAAKV